MCVCVCVCVRFHTRTPATITMNSSYYCCFPSCSSSEVFPPTSNESHLIIAEVAVVHPFCFHIFAWFVWRTHSIYFDTWVTLHRAFEFLMDPLSCTDWSLRVLCFSLPHCCCCCCFVPVFEHDSYLSFFYRKWVRYERVWYSSTFDNKVSVEVRENQSNVFTFST